MYTKTLVAGLAGLSLLLVPALSGAAAPNRGTWKGKDVSFIVKGRQGKVVGFQPTYRVEWKCGNGDTPWTKFSGLSAKIRGGRFSKREPIWIGSINRLLRVGVTGRFTSPRKATGTIVWKLAGCGSFSSRWKARGPARQTGGGGDSGGNPGKACIYIPLADGSGFICV